MVTGFEPIAGSLAAIALIFPVYDACKRLILGCTVMKSFGRDVQILWKQLNGQWVRLELIMKRDRLSLQNPPDSDDPFHWVTKTIKEHLEIIEMYFRECEQLVEAQFRNAGVSLDSIQASQSSGVSRSSLLTIETRLMRSSSSNVALEGVNDDSQPISKQPNSQTPSDWTKKKRKKEKKLDLLLRKVFAGRNKGRGEFAGTSQVQNAQQELTKSSETDFEAMDPTRLESKSLDHTDAEQPLRRTELPIPELKTTDMQHDAEVSRQNAGTIQKTTGIWTHIKWADHQKEIFRQKVTEIRKTINTLDKILTLRTPNSPSRLLAVQPDSSLVSHTNIEVQKALERLHRSLRKLNVSGPGSNPSKFAVHIAAPFDDNWRLVRDQCDLSLREPAQLFYVQQERQPEQSTLLLIETLTDPTRSVQHPSKDFQEISELNMSNHSTTLNPTDQYMIWGFIRTPDSFKDEHCIFRDPTGWKRKSTLADVIANPEDLQYLSTENVIILARRIMVAYLDFSLVRPSCPNPRLDNYVYYEPDTVATTSEDEGLLLLRPYLQCGFGCRAPIRQLGATSGPSKDVNASIIELGLVLFQIGSRRILTYQTRALGSTVELLRDVTNEALTCLEEVEQYHGPLLARVVELCLLSRANTELQNVSHGLTKLIELHNSLNTFLV